MTAAKLLHNALIVNEGTVSPGWVAIAPDGRIAAVGSGSSDPLPEASEVIDCEGAWLMPGVIDTHVHFRDPGLTDKADMASESRAALAGGVTSFIDMPNTKPPTVTAELVNDKKVRAREASVINYGFFIGATNDNLPELLAADYSGIAGIKLFLGSSTGNMLVDADSTLAELFAKAPAIIAVHAEDEALIRAARERLSAEYPEGIPVELHPDVRPREACIRATARAIAMAEQTGARLHVCHVSTADELRLIAEAKARGVKVTAETCPQYLLFDRTDFPALGARIKCNPAVKDPADRIALVRALLPGGAIDTIATDHAPHLPAQKQGDALTAASGMPMVQFSLPAMLDLMDSDPAADGLDITRIVELMCHAPARIFGIRDRGFIRPGCYADLVLVDSNPTRVTPAAILSKCGWSPLEGRTLSRRVKQAWVGGSPRALEFSS